MTPMAFVWVHTLLHSSVILRELSSNYRDNSSKFQRKIRPEEAKNNFFPQNSLWAFFIDFLCFSFALNKPRFALSENFPLPWCTEIPWLVSHRRMPPTIQKSEARGFMAKIPFRKAIKNKKNAQLAKSNAKSPPTKSDRSKHLSCLRQRMRSGNAEKNALLMNTTANGKG